MSWGGREGTIRLTIAARGLPIRCYNARECEGVMSCQENAAASARYACGRCLRHGGLSIV